MDGNVLERAVWGQVARTRMETLAGASVALSGDAITYSVPGPERFPSPAGAGVDATSFLSGVDRRLQSDLDGTRTDPMNLSDREGCYFVRDQASGQIAGEVKCGPVRRGWAAEVDGQELPLEINRMAEEFAGGTAFLMPVDARSIDLHLENTLGSRDWAGEVEARAEPDPLGVRLEFED